MNLHWQVAMLLYDKIFQINMSRTYRPVWISTCTLTWKPFLSIFWCQLLGSACPNLNGCHIQTAVIGSQVVILNALKKE